MIPSVTGETLKHKKTHMFSNGLIKVLSWICKQLDLHDNDALNIDVTDGKIVIGKSK